MWKVAAGVGIAVVALYLTKCHFRGGVCKCKTYLDGKVVIITGANSGIGRETALQLAKRGARVILGCRDANKGEETRNFIASQVDVAVSCYVLDLSSFRSVRTFVDKFYSEFGGDAKLDILINNAGVFHNPPETTDDGFDLTYQVNFLSAVLLTFLLLPAIQRASPARIIFTSSQAVFAPKELDVETLGAPRQPNDDSHFLVYGQAKLAQLLFVRKLASVLEGSGVVVNAADPGNVRTDILRHFPLITNFWSAVLSWPLRWLFFKSPLEGAQTIIHLALDSQLGRPPSGNFYRGASTSSGVEGFGEQTVVLLLFVDCVAAVSVMDRAILQPGKPGQRAFMGWTCRFSASNIEPLQSIPAEQTLNEGEHVLKIGDGDTEILRSLDKVLPLMNCDEVAQVVLKGRSGDLIRCEISLLEITQPDEFLGLDDEQILQRALVHKERAAALFKESRFIDAFHRFAFAAKDLMSTETILLEQEMCEVQPTLSKLFSNMAECHLRLSNFEEALDLANRALVYQPGDVKALFRAATSSWGLGDTDKANMFLDRLLEIEPKNVAALNLQVKVRYKVAEYEKNYEAMMKRVFAMY